jgi:hypothetical protein
MECEMARLAALTHAEIEEEACAVDGCDPLSASLALHDLRIAFQGVRQCMRRMGTAAGVPIEPSIVTPLLDRTMEIKGVSTESSAGGRLLLFRLLLLHHLLLLFFSSVSCFL